MLISTTLHETAHYVGADQETFINYENMRGMEEVIAETTAFLSAMELGLEFAPKNAAYISGWLEEAKKTHTDAMHFAFIEAIRRTPLVLGLVTREKTRLNQAA